MILNIVPEIVTYAVMDIVALVLLVWVIISMAEEIFPNIPSHKYPVQLYTLANGSNRFLMQDVRLLGLIFIGTAFLLWYLPVDETYQMLNAVLLIALCITAASVLIIAVSIRYMSIREQMQIAEQAAKRAVLPETFRF
jgi:hypothetical protein